MAKHIIINNQELINKYVVNKSEMQKLLKKELSDEEFMSELFKILKMHETEIGFNNFLKI